MGLFNKKKKQRESNNKGLVNSLELDENEIRAVNIIKHYGFDFSNANRQEIISLINEEFIDYKNGSSEYLRVLCGYLFCIGNPEDIELIEKIKYKINMDVGFMVDGDWIDRLNWVDSAPRTELIEDFVSYYKSYSDWRKNNT